MRARSLRLRLILGTTLCMAALYAVMSVVLYAVIQRSLWNELDAALLMKARALVAVVEQNAEGISLDVEPSKLEPVRGEDGFALWTDDGKVFAASANMSGTMNPVTEGYGEFTGYLQVAGHRARYVAIRFLPRLEEETSGPAMHRPAPMTLLVTRDTGSVDRKLWQLVMLLTGLCGVTIIAAALTLSWIIRRGLRPLDELASQIHGIGDDGLGEKIVLRDAVGEIQPIADRLNELLQRLQASFDRERAFTADVAHELRTPLAGLTAALEVCGAQHRAPADYERVLQRCLHTSRAMRAMVENLLTLARADARQLAIHKEPVDADQLIKEVWQTFEQKGAARGLNVRFVHGATRQMRTDRGLLELVLRNLMDNAVTYTPDAGMITIRTEADDAAFIVVMGNPSGSLRPADAGRIFDRFWRGDAARGSGGQHCGLGLALCRRVIGLLEGTIEADVNEGIFRVTVRIPMDAVREASVEPEMEHIVS
jgi:signal transduction histidine kinase